jgi:hypothetical protein
VYLLVFPDMLPAAYELSACSTALQVQHSHCQQGPDPPGTTHADLRVFKV